MDVVVVGAGVIGAAVAFRLAQAGARVAVLESAARVGAGTSGRSFAWTNSNQKTPRPYHDHVHSPQPPPYAARYTRIGRMHPVRVPSANA
jgi:glycine/D-amino acid oxidase-like deaminating enzyme